MHHKLGLPFYWYNSFLLLAVLLDFSIHPVILSSSVPVQQHDSLVNERTIKSTLAHSQIATPSTPETLHINMSSVNITWTYSDAPTDPPTQFIVQIRSQSFGDNKFHNLTTPLSKLYYVYTGLVYGVFYQFRVIAVRNGSFSEPSPSSFIFDNGMTAPPGPPEDLEVLVIQTDSVLFTWTEPKPSNELKYLYHVYEGKAADQLSLVDTIQQNTQYTFTQLEPFKKYYFSVQADWGGEKSILAPPVSKTLFNPSVLPLVTDPNVTVGYTSVSLDWVEPSVAQYNGHVHTYLVLYTPVTHDIPPFSTFQYVSTVTTPHTDIEDLEQNTTYAFTIQYTFQVNNSTTTPIDSNYSAPFKATTLPSLQCLSCHSVSSTQVSLFWEVLKTGNDLWLYTVTAMPSIGYKNFTSGNDNGTFIIQGLHPWTSYVLSIHRTGTYGIQIDHCPLIGCRTDEDIPSSYPVNIHAVAISTTSINISWSPVPVVYQNGIILDYIIGCPHCPIIQYVTTRLYHLVEDLMPNRNYSFVVAARNDKGTGPDSSPVLAKTIGKKLTSSPTNIVVRYATPDYVILSWQPPNSTQDSGPITLYTVTYKVYEDDNTWSRRIAIEGRPPYSSVSLNTTLTTTNLTNLLHNTTYTVRISAWTYMGEGPMSAPFIFHTTDPNEHGNTCHMCVLNMTIDISNPSRKCFDVVISWSVYGIPDDAEVVYYSLTLLSLGGDSETYTPNGTSTLVISSDSLDSNQEYLVTLEVQVQILNSVNTVLQKNSSLTTPPCTGVSTVVAVVTTTVCIVLGLIIVGVALVLFQRCFCRRKAVRINNSQAQMSRRFVVSNDYISLMKQQRGDGHSTNTGSVTTTASSSHDLISHSSSIEEAGEEEPLLRSSPDPLPTFSSHRTGIQLPPSFAVSNAAQTLSPSHKPENNIIFSTEQSLPTSTDGYLSINDLYTGSGTVPKQVPLRPDPEGSSLSSMSSESSTNSYNHMT